MKKEQKKKNGGRWLYVIVLWMFTLGAACMAPREIGAAGLLIADEGFGGLLEIKEHDVQVTINNGIAVTTVTQVFLNTENRQVEALYTFPVPKGASVANFSMWINGKEMVGEVLEKKRAREIYNSYKQKRRDPGLLEQVDYKTFEMRIFPINAGAEQKVQISYYQEMNFDHDQATYVYPLATVTRKEMDSRTTGKFAINMDITSAVPIVELMSPSHGDAFVVANHSDTYFRASLETSGGSLEKDVVLHYSLSRPTTGIDLITSRTGGEDGYILLTLTAGEELEKLNQGMDYVFVLDISGSMANDSKLAISRNSLEAFIDELSEEDRFEVMTFNVQPNMLFQELRPGNQQMKEMAQSYLNSQEARGGTNLVPAMTTAYKYGNPDRTLNVVILSDGMTEQGERKTLLSLIQQRPRFSRVFCIGIGNEVNRQLLEQIAEDSGGLASFVSRGDDFTRQARAFRRKLMRPAATDLQIDFGKLRVYDVEPATLPNLYHGSPIRIYGRYMGDGETTVTLRGTVLGREIKQNAVLEFPKKDTNNPEIERMWAWKRIDQLLKKADRIGSREQVVDEIITLGENYSIVTEYTSFLVLENDAEYKRWKIQRRNSMRIDRDRKTQTERAQELEKIRNRALADLGPASGVKNSTTPNVQNVRNASSSPQAQRTQNGTQQKKQNNASQPRGRSWDFDLGSGPVGPFFVGGAWWLRRKKKNSDKK